MVTGVQTCALPISRLASPPASVAESGISTTSSTATDVSPTTARLFAVSSSAPQPPILLLTSTPLATGTGSEQTIWIVTMKSWEAQILELGQKGAWEKAIRLLRRSGPGGGELPVRPSPLHLTHANFPFAATSATSTCHSSRPLALQRPPVRRRHRRVHRSGSLSRQSRLTLSRTHFREAFPRACGAGGSLWWTPAAQGPGGDRGCRSCGRGGGGGEGQGGVGAVFACEGVSDEGRESV